MKNIERRPSWQLSLAAIVLAATFSIIIISGFEILVAQSIILLSFFILSRRINLQMYIAAAIAAAVLTFMMNASVLIWVSPSLIIPVFWFKWNRTEINFIISLVVSLVLYAAVYSTAYAIDDEIIRSSALNVLILLVLGESMSASIICYLGEGLNERIT